MKTKVLMVLALVFMILPISSAFAYEGGFLQGNTTYPELTDNNLDTYISIGWSTTRTVDIGSDQTIERIYLKSNRAGGYYKVRLKNASGTVIASYNFATSTATTNGTTTVNNNGYTSLVTPVNNVRYAEIYTTGDAPSGNLMYEFDVYGAKPPINHMEIGNVAYSNNDNDITLTWSAPSTNEDFTNSIVYRDGVEVARLDKTGNVFVDNDLDYNTTYTYKVSALYTDDFETDGITQVVAIGAEPIDETKIPPSNPTALTVTDIASDSAKLKWTNSSDNDLQSVNIYNEDGTLLTNIPITSSYTINDLSPLTNYSFSIALVDRDGNESGKVPVTFKTLEGRDTTPPQPIENVKVTEGNSALYISWDKSPDSDVVGYDVYINGVKHNDKPIQNTFYTATGLENGVTYDVQVVAIDKAGNSSEVQAPVVQAPSEDAIPIFKTEYSLEDVANGVSAWFSEYWLILAFAISIPLSFYIASRVKLMFLE